MDLVLLLVLLGFSAGFSGSETAFFSFGAAELAKLRSSQEGAGPRIAALLQRSHDLLSALLMGNLLINTATSVVATAMCLRWFGPKGLAVAVPATTLALLLFGEITPKMLALRSRHRVARMAHKPLAIWLIVAGPFLRVTGLLVRGMLRLLPWDRSGTRPLTMTELQTACGLAVGDGTLSETEGRSLARLLALENLAVSHIMTPRTEVVTLRRDLSLRQVLATARRAGFNRYPVFEPAASRPAGMFHLKDLLHRSEGDDRPLQGHLRPMLFVPESKDVASLLGQMRSGDTHLAAVVDEHGDFTGIVTMADCLQALLGPVVESAHSAPEAIALGGGSWVIAGRTDLLELEELTGVKLPASHDYVSVAGFLMAHLGRIPELGDRLELSSASLVVLEMTRHRVDRIKVVRNEAVTGTGGEP